MPTAKYLSEYFAIDILLRLFLFSLYGVFQLIPPFKRVIHPEEVWLYKNPVTASYCPIKILWEIVVVTPSATIFANYIFSKNRIDLIQAFLAFSLTLCLNGALTNILKVVVGRPRPDYYYRCFPTGEGHPQIEFCTGDINVVHEGLKSFPSGHSSIAFASLGFLSLYLAGKMHLFAPSGKGSTWKLLLFLCPLFSASLVAISRLCDYHHHWQDVLCGSILGFTICWLCYHNYYPSLQDEHCHLPWVQINKKQIKELTVKDI
ncbi:Lipid phosphate phosphatase, putative [Pediculus humanus corporis]|uniref:Lipid phosphate phosphatase, putative n=1 Tax=Pediculus humanus subsp. corporis TaxID=121224 RepID=E0VG45_PEDHC|nr:Lipid phosphate phosphatase, putative [Pediculus humanus corporis]EEB12351.1 Lipid phosphate phosphatase, putative [Pediculus humanus corporis]